MNIINGKILAKQIREEVKKEVQELGITPGLAVILVGADPASHLYVGLKEKACKEVGIKSERFLYFATTPQEEIIKKILELNVRPDIHGILVQLPLPQGLDEDTIIRAIDPEKDVDGFHPKNIEALLHNEETVPPVLPRVILQLIESTKTNLRKKTALIIYNSEVFAAPVKKTLENAGAGVKKLHPDDPHLIAESRGADILIVAIGRPNFITADMVKDGAVVIDVGTNRLENKTIGDVDFEGLSEKSGWITPVPGGVGPMTVAMLLRNTIELAKKISEK